MMTETRDVVMGYDDKVTTILNDWQQQSQKLEHSLTYDTIYFERRQCMCVYDVDARMYVCENERGNWSSIIRGIIRGAFCPHHIITIELIEWVFMHVGIEVVSKWLSVIWGGYSSCRELLRRRGDLYIDDSDNNDNRSSLLRLRRIFAPRPLFIVISLSPWTYIHGVYMYTHGVCMYTPTHSFSPLPSCHDMGVCVCLHKVAPFFSKRGK